MNKKIAIMQPYFFPYIGYWQLMNAVDLLVVYDNIQYTKKGWINRNRYLKNGKAATFSLPLAKGSSMLDINQRYLSESFRSEGVKLLRQIEGAYKKAPNFDEGFDLFKDCLNYNNKNLFDFIYYSLERIKIHLGIKTKIVTSSSISCDHTLRSSERVKAICHALGANRYINPIGGIELYTKENFISSGIELCFIKPNLIEYEQFGSAFEAGLSVLDVIMFDSKSNIKKTIEKGYEII